MPSSEKYPLLINGEGEQNTAIDEDKTNDTATYKAYLLPMIGGNSGRRLFDSPEEIDCCIRDLRDEWD